MCIIIIIIIISSISSSSSSSSSSSGSSSSSSSSSSSAGDTRSEIPLIIKLLRTVRAWGGPGGEPWWCPVSQTYAPAGGSLCSKIQCSSGSSGARSVAYSPCGKYIAAACGNKIEVQSALLHCYADFVHT